MYCKSCGKQIDANSIFCKFCGQPQSISAKARIEEPRWETCEILYQIMSKKDTSTLFNHKHDVTMKFVAKAVGPRGVYIAAESPTYIQVVAYEASDYPWDHARAVPLVEALIAKLGRDGWESEGRGSGDYFHYKFRRVK